MTQQSKLSPEESSNMDSTLEKTGVSYSEYAHQGVLTPADAEFLANFSDERRKKVLRKVSLIIADGIVAVR